MRWDGIDGLTAVVTGAAGGIGSAVVTALARAGVHVTAVDRAPFTPSRDHRAPELRHLVRERTADVADERAARALLDETERDLGPVGLWVGAAGVLRHGPATGCSVQDWQALLHTNATGVFVWARAAAECMARHGRGAIVTVASNAVGVPRAGLAAYAASKAAASAFTLGLGVEVARHGVRCNVVCPGSTDTPMLQRLTGGADFAPVIDGDPAAFRTGIPLGRVAAPRDIADAVLFLASDQARHITLHSLYVDGGAALHG
ncbi:SDR family oxidoreductase [Streptomyces sp. G45]|uniref:SDR family oxidoreductase n=1 Tax=Streptomyces sp. G45 TaxID=3406627 RepID=UPI003C1340A4